MDAKALTAPKYNKRLKYDESASSFKLVFKKCTYDFTVCFSSCMYKSSNGLEDPRETKKVRLGALSSHIHLHPSSCGNEAGGSSWFWWWEFHAMENNDWKCTDPYHPQTLAEPLRRHCDAVLLPVWHHHTSRANPCYNGDNTFNILNLVRWEQRTEIHPVTNAQVGVSSLSYTWFARLSGGALVDICLSSLRGGHWMAMLWIYTWDVTIIHLRSLQMGSLLKG